jgi:hypothetical protein
VQTTNAGAAKRRITVILDLSGSNRLLLEMLPSLFGDNGDFDIDAVFVEESAHQRAAELPFVRELCLLTTVEREFGPTDLKRIIEVRKQRLRKLMKAAVAGYGVEYSIRGVQAAADLLQELASASDIMMFEPIRRLRRQFMNLPEPFAPRHGRVVVAIGDWPGAREVLLTGLRLAGGDQRRVAVLVTGDAATTRVADCVSRITGLLSGPPGSIRVVSGKETRAFIEATQAERPGVLVLGATAEWLDSSMTREMQEQLRCPVCLVRAKS